MNKYLSYFLLSVGILALSGIGIASAHRGEFGGFGIVSSEDLIAHYEAMFEDKAEILGLTLDEIKEAWSEGKSLRELAEEKGISQEQLRESMMQKEQKRMEERLQALVDGGLITQEQADKRMNFMTEKFQNGESRRGFRRGECIEGTDLEM